MSTPSFLPWEDLDFDLLNKVLHYIDVERALQYEVFFDYLVAELPHFTTAYIQWFGLHTAEAYTTIVGFTTEELIDLFSITKGDLRQTFALVADSEDELDDLIDSLNAEELDTAEEIGILEEDYIRLAEEEANATFYDEDTTPPTTLPPGYFDNLKAFREDEDYEDLASDEEDYSPYSDEEIYTYSDEETYPYSDEETYPIAVDDLDDTWEWGLTDEPTETSEILITEESEISTPQAPEEPFLTKEEILYELTLTEDDLSDEYFSTIEELNEFDLNETDSHPDDNDDLEWITFVQPEEPFLTKEEILYELTLTEDDLTDEYFSTIEELNEFDLNETDSHPDDDTDLSWITFETKLPELSFADIDFEYTPSECSLDWEPLEEEFASVSDFDWDDEDLNILWGELPSDFDHAIEEVYAELDNLAHTEDLLYAIDHESFAHEDHEFLFSIPTEIETEYIPPSLQATPTVQPGAQYKVRVTITTPIDDELEDMLRPWNSLNILEKKERCPWYYKLPPPMKPLFINTRVTAHHDTVTPTCEQEIQSAQQLLDDVADKIEPYVVPSRPLAGSHTPMLETIITSTWKPQSKLTIIAGCAILASLLVQISNLVLADSIPKKILALTGVVADLVALICIMAREYTTDREELTLSNIFQSVYSAVRETFTKPVPEEILTPPTLEKPTIDRKEFVSDYYVVRYLKTKFPHRTGLYDLVTRWESDQINFLFDSDVTYEDIPKEWLKSRASEKRIFAWRKMTMEQLDMPSPSSIMEAAEAMQQMNLSPYERPAPILTLTKEMCETLAHSCVFDSIVHSSESTETDSIVSSSESVDNTITLTPCSIDTPVITGTDWAEEVKEDLPSLAGPSTYIPPRIPVYDDSANLVEHLHTRDSRTAYDLLNQFHIQFGSSPVIYGEWRSEYPLDATTLTLPEMLDAIWTMEDCYETEEEEDEDFNVVIDSTETDKIKAMSTTFLKAAKVLTSWPMKGKETKAHTCNDKCAISIQENGPQNIEVMSDSWRNVIQHLVSNKIPDEIHDVPTCDWLETLFALGVYADCATDNEFFENSYRFTCQGAVLFNTNFTRMRMGRNHIPVRARPGIMPQSLWINHQITANDWCGGFTGAFFAKNNGLDIIRYYPNAVNKIPSLMNGLPLKLHRPAMRYALRSLEMGIPKKAHDVCERNIYYPGDSIIENAEITIINAGASYKTTNALYVAHEIQKSKPKSDTDVMEDVLSIVDEKNFDSTVLKDCSFDGILKLITGLISATGVATLLGLKWDKNNSMQTIATVNQGYMMNKNINGTIEWIAQCINPPPPTDWRELAKDLHDRYQILLSIPSAYVNTTPGLVVAVKEFSAQIKIFLSRLSSVQKTTETEYYSRLCLIMQNKMDTHFATIVSNKLTSTSRVPTVIVQIAGKEGLGKTTSLSGQGQIITEMRRILSLPDDFEPHKLNIDNNGYMNPCDGRSVGVKDEFLKEGANDPIIPHINYIASSQYYPLVGAFEKDTPCAYRVLFLLSNEEHVNIASLVPSARTAFWSRILRYRVSSEEVTAAIRAHGRNVNVDRNMNLMKWERMIHPDVGNPTYTPVSFRTMIDDIHGELMKVELTNGRNAPLSSIVNLVKGNLNQYIPTVAPLPDYWESRADGKGKGDEMPKDQRQPVVAASIPKAATYDHLVMHFHGPTGCGKSTFKKTLRDRFRTMDRSIPIVELSETTLKTGQPYPRTAIYILDDLIVANEEAYHRFYDSLTAASIIVIFSNVELTQTTWSKYNPFGSSPKWTTNLTIPGVVRRAGFDRMIETGKYIYNPNMNCAYTFTFTSRVRVEHRGKECTPAHLIPIICQAVRHWRQVSNQDIEPDYRDQPFEYRDGDIVLDVPDYQTMKNVMSSKTNMLVNAMKPGSCLQVKPALLSMMKGGPLADASTWKIPDTDEDMMESIKTYYSQFAQVFPDVLVSVKVGETIVKAGRGELLVYTPSVRAINTISDTNTITIKWTDIAGKHEHTMCKDQLAEAYAKGFSYNTMGPELPDSAWVALLQHKDKLMLDDADLFSRYQKHGAHDEKKSYYQRLKDWMFDNSTTLSSKLVKTFLALGSLYTAWKIVRGTVSIVKWLFSGSDYITCAGCKEKVPYAKIYDIKQKYGKCMQCRIVTTDGTSMTQLSNCPMTIMDKSGKVMTRPAAPVQPNSIPTGERRADTQRIDEFMRDRLIDYQAEKWEMEGLQRAYGTLETSPKANPNLLNKLLDKVEQNTLPVVTVSGNSSALCLGGRLCAFVAHMLWNTDETSVMIKQNGQFHVAKVIWFDYERDLALAIVISKHWNEMSDLMKYVVTHDDADEVTGAGLFSCTNKRWLPCKLDHQSKTYLPILDPTPECDASRYIKTYARIYSTRLDTEGYGQKGTCGSAVIALNSKGDRMITGIFAGTLSNDSTKGNMSILTQELIQHAVQSETIKTSPKNAEGTTTFSLEKEGLGRRIISAFDIPFYQNINPDRAPTVRFPDTLQFIGHKTSFAPEKKKLQRTTLYQFMYEKYGPPPCINSLTPYAEGVPVERNANGVPCAFTNEIMKMRPNPQYNLDLYSQTTDYVRNVLNEHYERYTTFNTHEVLNGTHDVSRMKTDTAPGFVPHSIFPHMSKKGMYFDNNEGVLSWAKKTEGQMMRSRENVLHKCLLKGDALMFVSKAAIKEELLPSEKVLQKGKRRLYSSTDIVANMLEKRFAGGFLDGVLRQSGGPIVVGINFRVALNNYKHVFTRFTRSLSLDREKFDKRICHKDLVTAYSLVLDMNDDLTQTQKDAFIQTFTLKCMHVRDALFVYDFGVNSGDYLTNIVGSVVSLLHAYYGIGYALQKKGLSRDGLSSFFVIANGDDTQIMSDGTVYVDPYDIIEGMNHTGVVTTPATKDGAAYKWDITPSHGDFVSRHISLKDGMIFGALKFDSILKSLYFSRDKSIQNMTYQMSFALQEVFNYQDRQLYDTFRKNFMEGAAIIDPYFDRTLFPSYAEQSQFYLKDVRASSQDPQPVQSKQIDLSYYDETIRAVLDTTKTFLLPNSNKRVNLKELSEKISDIAKNETEIVKSTPTMNPAMAFAGDRHLDIPTDRKLEHQAIGSWVLSRNFCTEQDYDEPPNPWGPRAAMRRFAYRTTASKWGAAIRAFDSIKDVDMFNLLKQLENEKRLQIVKTTQNVTLRVVHPVRDLYPCLVLDHAWGPAAFVDRKTAIMGLVILSLNDGTYVKNKVIDILRITPCAGGSTMDSNATGAGEGMTMSASTSGMSAASVFAQEGQVPPAMMSFAGITTSVLDVVNKSYLIETIQVPLSATAGQTLKIITMDDLIQGHPFSRMMAMSSERVSGGCTVTVESNSSQNILGNLIVYMQYPNLLGIFQDYTLEQKQHYAVQVKSVIDGLKMVVPLVFASNSQNCMTLSDGTVSSDGLTPRVVVEALTNMESVISSAGTTASYLMVSVDAAGWMFAGIDVPVAAPAASSGPIAEVTPLKYILPETSVGVITGNAEMLHPLTSAKWAMTKDNMMLTGKALNTWDMAYGGIHRCNPDHFKGDVVDTDGNVLKVCEFNGTQSSWWRWLNMRDFGVFKPKWVGYGNKPEEMLVPYTWGYNYTDLANGTAITYDFNNSYKLSSGNVVTRAEGWGTNHTDGEYYEGIYISDRPTLYPGDLADGIYINSIGSEVEQYYDTPLWTANESQNGGGALPNLYHNFVIRSTPVMLQETGITNVNTNDDAFVSLCEWFVRKNGVISGKSYAFSIVDTKFNQPLVNLVLKTGYAGSDVDVWTMYVVSQRSEIVSPNLSNMAVTTPVEQIDSYSPSELTPSNWTSINVVSGAGALAIKTKCSEVMKKVYGKTMRSTKHGKPAAKYTVPAPSSFRLEKSHSEMPAVKSIPKSAPSEVGDDAGEIELTSDLVDEIYYNTEPEKSCAYILERILRRRRAAAHKEAEDSNVQKSDPKSILGGMLSGTGNAINKRQEQRFITGLSDQTYHQNSQLSTQNYLQNKVLQNARLTNNLENTLLSGANQWKNTQLTGMNMQNVANIQAQNQLRVNGMQVGGRLLYQNRQNDFAGRMMGATQRQRYDPSGFASAPKPSASTYAPSKNTLGSWISSAQNHAEQATPPDTSSTSTGGLVSDVAKGAISKNKEMKAGAVTPDIVAGASSESSSGGSAVKKIGEVAESAAAVI